MSATKQVHCLIEEHHRNIQKVFMLVVGISNDRRKEGLTVSGLGNIGCISRGRRLVWRGHHSWSMIIGHVLWTHW